MEKNINIQQTYFCSFQKNQSWETKKKIIDIVYLLIELIKNGINILEFQLNLACKYGIIHQISRYKWMQNCIFWYLAQQLPVRQSYNRNLIQFIFWIKVFFYVNVFKVDFVLNIGVYLCLFAFSWIEIKHKTRCCHRENSFVLTNKMYKQKLRKRKTVNVQIKKMNKVVEENHLAVMVKILLWEFNLHWKFMGADER